MKNQKNNTSIPPATDEEARAFMARQQQPSSETIADKIGDEALERLAQLQQETSRVSVKEKLAKYRDEVAKRVPPTNIRQRVREIAILIYPTYYTIAGTVEEVNRLLQKSPWLEGHPVIEKQRRALEGFGETLAEEYKTEDEDKDDSSVILGLLQKVDEAVGKSLRQVRTPRQLNELLNNLTKNQLVWRPSRVASEQLKEGVVLGERVYLPYRGNDLSLVAFPQIREVCNTITEAWEAKREAHRQHRKEFERRGNIKLLEALEGKEGILLVQVLASDQTGREKPALILLQIGRRTIGREAKPAYRILEGLEPWVQWVKNYCTDKEGKERWFALNPPEFRIEGIMRGTRLYQLVNQIVAPALASQYQVVLEKERGQAERQAQKKAALARREELLAQPGISPAALLAGEAGICNYRLDVRTRSREDDLTISTEGDGQGNITLVEYISTMKFGKPEIAIDLDKVVGKEIPLTPPEGEKEEGVIRVFRYILNCMADDYRVKELAQSSTVTATQFVDEKVAGICAFVNHKAQIGDSRGALALAYERKRKNGRVYFKGYVSLGGMFGFLRGVIGQEIPLDELPDLPDGEKETPNRYYVRHLRQQLLNRVKYEAWVVAGKPREKTEETSEEEGDVSSGEES